MKALFTISIFLLLLNVIVFLNKDKFVYTNNQSYSQIYQPSNFVGVKKIVRVNDSALQFSLLNQHAILQPWEILIDDNLPIINNNKNPTLPLLQGVHHYTIYTKNYSHTVNYTDTLFARIEYIPENNSLSNEKPYLGIYKSNISEKPAIKIESDKEILKNISGSEISDLQNIIKYEIKILPTNTDEQIVEKVTKYLHNTIYKSRGVPNTSTTLLNPYQQFLAAKNGKAINCGIYANIFNVFLYLNKICCRTVFIFNNYSSVSGSAHVCNEYYLKSKKQWVAADIMFNNSCYYNANGQLLNAVQVKNILQNDSTVLCKKVLKDSVILQPYSLQEKAFFDMYGIEKNIIYIFNNTDYNYNGIWAKRIKNYVLPRSRYLYYTDCEIPNNRNFYIKQILFFLLLTFCGITTLAFYKQKFIK